jgi:hypothetical protein
MGATTAARAHAARAASLVARSAASPRLAMRKRLAILLLLQLVPGYLIFSQHHRIRFYYLIKHVIFFSLYHLDHNKLPSYMHHYTFYLARCQGKSTEISFTYDTQLPFHKNRIIRGEPNPIYTSHVCISMVAHSCFNHQIQPQDKTPHFSTQRPVECSQRSPHRRPEQREEGHHLRQPGTPRVGSIEEAA